MPEDPFKDFKNIPPLDEMMKAAFNRANKRAEATSNKGPAVLVAKKKEIQKIEIACDYIIDALNSIVKSVPDLSQLPPFYFELAQVLVDNDAFKQKLGRMSGATKVIDKVKREQIRKAASSKAVATVKEARKQAFGRLKSVLDRLDGDLAYLASARRTLKSLPVVNMHAPCVVFAGYPNVGKSSCINNLCGSKIQVAQYPFTTKEVKVGLYREENWYIQFIDTPGILDRPMSKRNQIERQAIVAMQHVAHLIVFVLDPTLTSGYGMDEQLELFKEVKATFPGTPRVVLVNKVDASTTDEITIARERLKATDEQGVIEYSALSRAGEATFLAAIKDFLKGHEGNGRL